MELAVLDKANKKIREIKLSDESAEKVNKAVLYYAIKAARNNLRHGTAAVKDRSAVTMTNKKIYRQKGTGGARHAARSANIFVGGGSAHGPHPRSYVEKVNKKFKIVSYREAFKYLIQNNHLKVIDGVTFDKPSTKEAAAIFKKFGFQRALMILPKADLNTILSFRNLKNVNVISESNINIYDLFKYENVVLTATYFEQIKERFSL